MATVSHNRPPLESSRATTPTPRFAGLGVRELVFLLLVAQSHGLAPASVDQARNEILRREGIEVSR